MSSLSSKAWGGYKFHPRFLAHSLLGSKASWGTVKLEAGFLPMLLYGSKSAKSLLEGWQEPGAWLGWDEGLTERAEALPGLWGSACVSWPWLTAPLQLCAERASQSPPGHLRAVGLSAGHWPF